MKLISFPFRLLTADYGMATARTPVIERKNYECCTIEFVFEGKGFLEINGESFVSETPSVYFLHKRSHHRYRPDKTDPWKKIFFVVDGELMDHLFQAYRLDGVYHIAGIAHVRQRFDEMILLKHGTGLDTHQRAAVIFHQLLKELHDHVYQETDRGVPLEILRLKRELEKHVEENVVLEELCRSFKRSPEHLIRKFKLHFGVTPYGYLMDRRIELARSLLRHSAFSIKEIASRLKFSDQYYFSNYFKGKVGVSPRQYRK